MPDRFVRKLERFEKLSRADRQAVFDVTQNIRRIGARKIVDHNDGCLLFLGGLACRFQMPEDGTRQITDFIVPGDLCMAYPALHDCGIGTLSQSAVAYISEDQLVEMMERHPRISRALWRVQAAETALLREWIANIGRRPADKRVAHMLCELCLRLGALNQPRATSCVLPLSQIDLADATALSSVHINRVLGRLRDRRLVVLQRRSIIVKDIKRLMVFAQFNDAYLNLQPETNAPV